MEKSSSVGLEGRQCATAPISHLLSYVTHNHHLAECFVSFSSTVVERALVGLIIVSYNLTQ